jgi:hypothetical protein
MSNLLRTQIYLEDGQIAALDARADALGVTRSDVIRDMVDRGLAAEDLRPRLHDVVMRLAKSAAPSRPAGNAAARRASLEAEFDKRAAAEHRRRRQKAD